MSSIVPQPVNPGDTFARWTVLSVYITGKGKTSNRAALCRCECGTEREILVYRLRGNYTGSCGCLSRELAKVRETTHGLSKTRLHGVWCAIKARCGNPNNPTYRYYGERGIVVCPEWRDSFETFRDWALSNGYAEDLSIDRVDNDSGYSPDNCRWSNYAEQARNRSDNINITAFGETRCLQDWIGHPMCPHQCTDTIAYRIKTGWKPEDALSLGPNRVPDYIRAKRKPWGSVSRRSS